jgi:undecaprenyl-diphosphatase
MADTLNQLIDWLNQNPNWIATAIGLTALVESLAMIGVIIPGVALLYAGAAIAGSLGMSAWPCLLAAILGAVIGDVASFLLGRYAHRPALKHWPFRQHPDWLERGEGFIDRYGAPSVIIGRFVGPIRPVLPFVAGMLQMPPHRFVAINLFSALLWAPVYILPGYLFGHFGRIGLEQAAQDGLLNLLLLAIIALSLLCLFGLHRWLHPQQPQHQQLATLLRLEQLRSPRNSELPLGSALMLFSCTLVFTLLAVAATFGNPLQPVDQVFSTLLQQLRTPTADQLWVAITLLGDGWHLTLWSLWICALLWLGRQRAAALHWFVALMLSIGLSHLLKLILTMPRPELLAASFGSFSFPSAHSANSTLFLGLGASFIAQQVAYQWRWWVYAPAALLMLVMAFSRVYLGAHWFSDVIAGGALGLAICGAARISYSRFDQQPIRVNGWLLGAGMLVLTTTYLFLRFDGQWVRYLPL